MTKDCSTTFAAGTVVLTAVPDAAFGFTGTLWYGDCDTISGNTCTVNLSVGAVVEACFHDGSAMGMGICDDAQ